MPIVYFIAGILFVELILPILSKYLELFAAKIELRISKIGEGINESNIKIQQAQVKAEIGEDLPKYQIGFALPAIETEDYEDVEGDEEDDDEV